MDQTLLAILIGAGVSIGTTVISQLFIMSKEKRQWERERKSRLDDQKSIEETEKRELIREAYSHSIEAVSALMTIQSLNSFTREKSENYIGELNKWLAVLTLVNSDQFDNQQKENFLNDYDNVTKNLNHINLNNLRVTLISMSLSDKRI